MRTVSQFLATLPPPICHNAMRLYRKQCEFLIDPAKVEEFMKTDEAESLGEALSAAFDWESTNQGRGYWQGICDQYSGGPEEHEKLYRLEDMGGLTLKVGSLIELIDLMLQRKQNNQMVVMSRPPDFEKEVKYYFMNSRSMERIGKILNR